MSQWLGSDKCLIVTDLRLKKVKTDACVFPGPAWIKAETPESPQDQHTSADHSPLSLPRSYAQLKPLPLSQTSTASCSVDAKSAKPAMQREAAGVSSSTRTCEKDLTQSKILLCEYCDASFTSTGGLSLHKNSVHFQRKFVCSICLKVLKRKATLINHMKTHNPLVHECPICHICFGTKDIHQHTCTNYQHNPSSS